MQADLSNRILKSLFIYFKRRHGEVALQRALTGAALGVDQAYLEDETNWVSLAMGQKLIDTLTEASGDPEFPRSAGHALASRESLGWAYTLLKAFGSPQLCYRKTLEISGLWNRAGVFEVQELSSSRIVFSYRSLTPEANRHFCEYRTGQFESFPAIWGLPLAKGRELQCQAKGAPCCIYEFGWLSRSWLLEPIIGTAIGLAGAVGLHLALSSPGDNWIWGLAGALGGALVGTVLNGRRQLKQRDLLLFQQNEDAIRALGDLQRRFDEVGAINRTLDGKVAERTRDLQVATDRLEAALSRQVELDRAKSRFFTNISHELRTPLTLILGPLESLLGSAPPELVGQLDIMQRNGLRLLKQINAILDLSRLDAGRERLKLQDTDVPALLQALVDSARPLAERRGVQLVMAVQGDVPNVPVDRDKLEKIVLNLISNALKFSGPKAAGPGRVKLGCTIQGDKLRLTCEDNGIGIPPDELSRIFDRFHQVEDGSDRAREGTGIGLALVKELAEHHLGAVSVESTLGKGSVFSVELPLRADAYPPERTDRRHASREVSLERRSVESLDHLGELVVNPAALELADLREGTAAIESVADPSKPLILVVDDNQDMRGFVTRLLASDYQVCSAPDADEGLRIALSLAPALIISDVMMPRRSGHELLRDLRADPRTRHTPIILLTAKADLQSKLVGLGGGADDYLTKPFHVPELKTRIRSLLNQRRLERELAGKNQELEKVNFDLILSRKEVFLQTIEAFAFAVEAKDPYTHGHSRRVSILAENLARRLAFSDADCEKVRIAAVLHDIGKIGIPESVLQKPGKLTPEEFAIIKAHPTIGHRILESIKELSEINRCILFHHERLDGRGYPDGRSGDDIPLSSRVVAVADTYDAMTSTRVYRKGLSHRTAIEELERFKGIQFDPGCVEGFLALYADTPPSFPDFPSALRGISAIESLIKVPA